MPEILSQNRVCLHRKWCFLYVVLLLLGRVARIALVKVREAESLLFALYYPTFRLQSHLDRSLVQEDGGWVRLSSFAVEATCKE